MQLSAAPRPRPPPGLPQPISPTRITSLPPACTLLARASSVAKAAPITDTVDVFRNSRRFDVVLEELLVRSEAMIDSPSSICGGAESWKPPVLDGVPGLPRLSPRPPWWVGED